MQKQPTVAELRFTAQGVTLYGTVMQMSAADITIRLHPGPASRDLFAINNVVEIVVVARNTMFTALTQIVGSTNGMLQLMFSSLVHAAPRRKEQRVPLDIGISFRSVQDNGCCGLWKNGLCKDISSRGMCLIIPTGLEAPRKMEVLFSLPNPLAELDIAALVCTNEDIEALNNDDENRLPMLRTADRDRPLKATGRVSNQRPRDDGYAIVGLTFTVLSPADQIRVAHFLNVHF